MRKHSVVAALLYMDRFSKANICITKNFSSKQRSLCQATSQKQYKIKHGMVYFGGRGSRTF